MKRDDGVASAGPRICTSLQTENHASTSSMFTGWMLFLTFNQQCQSTEANDSCLSTALQLQY